MSRLLFNVHENYIEVAQVTRYLNSPKLKKVFDFTPVDDHETNYIELKKLLKRNRINEKNVEVILSVDGIVTRQIDVPYMKAKDLNNFVKNNMGQYFTVNPNEFYFDYKVMGLKKEEKKIFSVLLVAVPKEKVDRIKNFVKLSRLNLIKIKIYPDCVASFFRKYKNESIAVLDADSDKSSITILDNGKIFVYSMQQLDLSDEDNYGELLDNLNYFLNFYSSRNFGKKMDKVFVSGEKIREESFKEFLTENLDAVLTFQLPYNKKEDESRFVEVLGSAVEERAYFNKQIDFKEIINEKTVQDKNTLAYALLGIMFLALVGWVAYFYTNTYLNNNDLVYNQVQKELDQYSYVDKTISDLNKESQTYQVKIGYINEIKKDQFDYISIIDAFKNGLPKNITVNNLVISSDSVTVTLNIKNSTLDAARAVIAINNMKKFDTVDITEVKLDDTINTLTLDLKPKNPS